jgi:tetratricopeptide (TPR) repeat protein
MRALFDRGGRPRGARAVWLGSAALALALLCVGASGAAAQETMRRTVDYLIEEMRLASAEELIERMEVEHPGSADTLYARSRLLFFRGDYESAVEYAEQAVTIAGASGGRLVEHRDLVAATAREVADYETYTSAGGHFVIRYHPRDRVLVEMTAETLEAAYVEIGFDFGYWPEEPVRVEIYPRTSSLANVSSLSEEAIETSGTIALCKYNRLMFTSPRALVRGYGWRDTVSHEYVHYVLQQLTGTRIPIWLHEGLAKFQETRWRGTNERTLPPANEDLLARRLEADDLITFEQMHPSMALLPSQEDSGTAFAQVYTVIEYLYAEQGVEGLRQLVHAIASGSTVEEAIEVVTGLGFEAFERRWDAHLRARSYRRLPSEYHNEMQFRPDDASEAPEDELAGIEEAAQDHMHLGQLLRARDRVAASIVEYRKAEALIGDENPVLQNWMARALLDLERTEEAVAALGDAAEYYPTFYLTYLHLGEAYLDLGHADEALPHLVEAAGINPFDPEVHRQLSRAYLALGDTERADRALRDAAAVSAR